MNQNPGRPTNLDDFFPPRHTKARSDREVMLDAHLETCSDCKAHKAIPTSPERMCPVAIGYYRRIWG